MSAPEIAGISPAALSKAPTALQGVPVGSSPAKPGAVNPATGGLKIEFAGGTVEISKEAMERNLAMAGCSLTEAAELSTHTMGLRRSSARMNFPPTIGDLYPDLGERVL